MTRKGLRGVAGLYTPATATFQHARPLAVALTSSPSQICFLHLPGETSEYDGAHVVRPQQEQATNSGTKAVDAPDKVSSQQTQSESVEYLDTLICE